MRDQRVEFVKVTGELVVEITGGHGLVDQSDEDEEEADGVEEEEQSDDDENDSVNEEMNEETVMQKEPICQASNPSVECAICLETANLAFSTECQHKFCYLCVKALVEPECPLL